MQQGLDSPHYTTTKNGGSRDTPCPLCYALRLHRMYAQLLRLLQLLHIGVRRILTSKELREPVAIL